MRIRSVIAVTVASLLVVTGAGALAVGDYVYTSGTEVADEVELAAWWIDAKNSDSNKTVIVTHSIGTSKQDFDTPLPAAMLVKNGFNVLLVL